MLQLKFTDLNQAKEKAASEEVRRLPLSAQALYFHVVFNGTFDEDGNVTNIEELAEAIGASSADVKTLTDEGFYRIVDEFSKTIKENR